MHIMKNNYSQCINNYSQCINNMYNTKYTGVLLKTPKEKERIHNYYTAIAHKDKHILHTVHILLNLVAPW